MAPVDFIINLERIFKNAKITTIVLTCVSVWVIVCL